MLQLRQIQLELLERMVGATKAVKTGQETAWFLEDAELATNAGHQTLKIKRYLHAAAGPSVRHTEKADRQLFEYAWRRNIQDFTFRNSFLGELL